MSKAVKKDCCEVDSTPAEVITEFTGRPILHRVRTIFNRLLNVAAVVALGFVIVCGVLNYFETGEARHGILASVIAIVVWGISQLKLLWLADGDDDCGI